MSKTIKKWQDLYQKNANCMTELLRTSNGELTKEQVLELLTWAGESDINMEEYLHELTLRKPSIYAVDFDGTLFIGAEFPQIGRPNHELISFLKERKEEGDKLILWTCRSGHYLKTAVKNANLQGLYFDAVNENLTENIEEYGNNCRKVYADFYIDDKNMPFNTSDISQNIDTLIGMLYKWNEQFNVQERKALYAAMVSLQKEKYKENKRIFKDLTYRKDVEYGDYPTLEEIVRDYEELISVVENVLTVEGLLELERETSLTLEVNGTELETFISDGGTNEDITSIRYEAYGCLGYIYLKIKDGFIDAIYTDVWSNKWNQMLVEDSSIANLKTNYERYVELAEERWLENKNGTQCQKEGE